LQTASSTAISFSHVTKRFQLRESSLREYVPALFGRKDKTPPFYALNDVSFTIEKGETVGIVGRNGSGKSTALKLMAGVMAPTAGEVLISGRISPLIELGAGFHPDLTGRENVFLNASILGVANSQARERLNEIIDFAELAEFMDMPVKRYSSGMYTRLGFSVAVHSDPDILLIDEVLAVGDSSFQEKCMHKMREFKRAGITIIVVSHTPGVVTEFCDRAIWLDHGRLRGDGPSAEVMRDYAESVPHYAETV
jgi:ABC-type polysaccharide/polyol phosphate transport system ATPase subunit